MNAPPPDPNLLARMLAAAVAEHAEEAARWLRTVLNRARHDAQERTQ